VRPTDHWGDIMRTRRNVLFVAVLLVPALTLPVSASSGASEVHCPGAQDEQSNVYVPVPDGYTVLAKTEVPDSFGPTLELEAGTFFCVKAANWASGILEMDASGSYTTPVDANASPHPPDISYYVTYARELPPPPPPATVDITLAKAWFDVDGQPVTGATEGWALRLTVSEDGTTELVVATLPGSPTATFEVGSRYGVHETVPAGWKTVPCDTVAADEIEIADVVGTDTSAIQSARTPEVGGSFGATDTGVHLVCNQQVPTTPPPVVPPVVPPVEPPVGPPPAVPPVEVLPETIEREPTPGAVEERQPPEEVTEVLGVVLEKPTTTAAPTRVDAGTGGLVRTGIPAAVLLLMGCGLFLLGVGTLGTSRQR
jgi:hypothetical protein